MPGDPPAAGAELLGAAEEIIAAAAAAGATVRLLGGIAVFQLAPSSRTAPLARPYHDYDVVVPSATGPLPPGSSATPATQRTSSSTRCTAPSG